MKNQIIICLSISIGVTMAARHMLDEEEFIMAKQFRDEALEVEREVAKLELLARQAADVAEVVPVLAPIDLRLGGRSHPQYGQSQPQHHSQYWAPTPASRTVGDSILSQSIHRMCSEYAQSVLREYTEGTQKVLKSYSELVQSLLKEQSEQKSRHNCGK